MAKIVGTAGSAPPAKPRRKPKPAPRRPYRPVQSPDSRDNNQAARHPAVSHVSPDAADVAGRSPQQHAHDRQVSAQTIAAERLAYLHEQERGRASLANRAAHGVSSVVRRAAEMQSGVRVSSARPPARLSPAELRIRSPFDRNPIRGLSQAENRAVASLAALQSSDPAGYRRRLAESARAARAGREIGATVTAKTGAAAGIGRAGEATAIGIAMNPKVAIPKTLSGLKDAAIGIPSGIVHTVLAPGETVKQQAADYKRRYGGINDPGGVDRMARRVSKEGAAPELFDLTTVGVPTGKILDLGLGRLGRAGALGGKLQRAATRARPAVRTSGEKVAQQATPPGLVRAVLAHRRDRAAAAAVQRTVDQADKSARKHATRNVEGARGQQPLTDVRRPKGPVDAVVRVAHEHGQIVPTRRSVVPGRRVISGRKLRKAQRVAYSKTKGQRLITQRNEQRTEINRGSNRRLASLSRWERRGFKTAMQLDVATPEAGRAAIERRIRVIEKARAEGRDVASTHDELPTLRRLLEHAHETFTPRLAAVVRDERMAAERDATGDPGLGTTPTERAATSEARRMKPLARTVGEQRRGTPVGEAIRIADRGVKAAQRQRDKVRAVRDRTAQRAAAARGYAQHGADQSKRSIDKQIAREQRVIEMHRRAAANHHGRADRARTDANRAGHHAHGEAALERMRRAQERLAQLRGNRDAARPDYRRAVQRADRRAADAQRELDRATEAVRTAGQTSRQIRRQKRQGIDLIGAEPLQAFHARVRTRARELGLGQDGRPVTPGYFPSRKREGARFSPRTIGGARRVKPDRQYGGKVFEAGRESNDLTTYTTGRAQNIKRKHNWGLVSDTIREHGLSHGLHVGQALDLIARKGWDPDSVRVVDLDAFDRAASEASLEGGPIKLDAGAGGDAELHAALTKAVHSVGVGGHGGLMLSDGAHLEAGAGRVTVLPKAVADEILADTRPSHGALRALDIFKGKQARIMLGLSPAWLQFQVAANGLQALAATKTLPHEWVIANLKWWRGLSEAERAHLEPYVGIGAFHDSVEHTHLGAASTGGIVDAYRAFKAHPWWHTPRKPLRGAAVSQLNPLDALFRLDNAQNNFFRRAVLYNQLKRQAYKSMGDRIAVHQQIMDRIFGTAGKDARSQMRAIIDHPAELEAAAQQVRDFLGDYQTYTSRERRVLGRNVMFYGYLRWSLRFAFYTMPVKHPVMTAILGQLGHLQTQEVRKLLGGDQLPWALGKLYFSKGGKLSSVDLTRANPLLNAVTQTKVAEQGLVRGALASAIGMLPPAFGAALDVAFAKSAYKGKPLKVEGETTERPNTQGPRITDLQAIEIYGKEMLDLAAPYRAAENVKANGRPISDNSLLFRQRYTTYKDPQRRLEVQQAQQAQTPGQRLLGQLVPLIPQPSQDVAAAASIRRATGVKSTSTVKLTPEQRAEVRAQMREAAAANPGGGGGGAGMSKSEINALLREARAGG